MSDRLCASVWSRLTRRTLVTFLGLTLVASLTVVAGSQERASAQAELDTTMLLFDLSGSMSAPQADGRTRLQVAQQAMVDAIGGIAPGSRNIGVRSFSDCGVTTLEQAPAPVDQASLSTTINSLVPQGLTDISVALTAVADDFATASGRSTVILLSDGEHNCGGDPCVTAANLIAGGIDIVVHAIGIDTAGTTAEAQLSCIANVTGGTVVSVDSTDELFDAIDEAFEGSGAGSGIIRSQIATCINSPIVQNDPALASLTVGSVYGDGIALNRILVTGEQCDFACNDGFDMNCDGVLGDFCDSAFDLNTVFGVGECLESLGDGGDETDAEIFNALLEKHCLGEEVLAAAGAVDPAELGGACNDYRRAKLFQERADSARSNGDNSHGDYNQVLADDAFENAQEVVTVFCESELADAPRQRAAGYGWSMDYRISGDDGLVLTDVALGTRQMAERVSIPYLNVRTSESGTRGLRIELTNSPIKGDCPGATSRSRLVSIDDGPRDGTLRVVATYRVDQIEGLDGVLTVTQRYEFDTELTTGECEPTQSSPAPVKDPRIFPCSPFRFTVDYDYAGPDAFTSIEIPQRMHFRVDGRTNNTAAAFQDRDGFIDTAGALGNPVRTFPVATENVWSAISRGQQATLDNYHQTSLGEVGAPQGFPVAKPGCPECVHMHWRWSSLIGHPQYGQGSPLIPAGSTQDLELGFSDYNPGELDPERYFDVIQARDAAPLNDPVMWYISRSSDASDTFFAHPGRSADLPGRGGAFFSIGYVDLAIAAQVADELVGPDEPTLVTSTVRNTGPGTASNVKVRFVPVPGEGAVVEDTLPANCELESVVNAVCSYDELGSGRLVSVGVEVTSLQAGPASVELDVRSDQVEFQEGNETAVVSFAEAPGNVNLKLEGSGGPDSYRLIVENIQSFDAREVKLTVQLPDSVDPTEVDVDAEVNGDCSVDNARSEVICEWDILIGPGGTQVVDISIPSGVEPGEVLVASVTSRTPDGDESNNRIEIGAG